MSQNKWLNGITNLEKHGIDHLSKDIDSDSRIGYITIDVILFINNLQI